MTRILTQVASYTATALQRWTVPLLPCLYESAFWTLSVPWGRMGWSLIGNRYHREITGRYTVAVIDYLNRISVCKAGSTCAQRCLGCMVCACRAGVSLCTATVGIMQRQVLVLLPTRLANDRRLDKGSRCHANIVLFEMNPIEENNCIAPWVGFRRSIIKTISIIRTRYLILCHGAGSR